jgi:outer membrane receptor protein involved in Fe transport
MTISITSSNRKSFFALLVGTSLATTPALAATAAQEDPSGPAAEVVENSGNDIVVTAQKRSENLQDVPISIQAFGEKKLDEHQVASFDDYAKLLPSVSFQSFGPGQSQIYFRGVTSGADGQHNGSLPTSALYVDEIPLTTIGGSVDLHVYDIQRVEALSGPQGTLFGSSSLAGTLRLITNKPSDKFEAGVDIGGTTFGKGRNSSGGSFDGFVNVPLSPHIALRASAFYVRDGGYISNTPFTRVYNALDFQGNPTTVSSNNTNINGVNLAKPNFNTTDTYGGRAALGIDLSENWTVTPSVIYQHQKSKGAFLFDPNVGDLEVHDFTPEFNNDEWTQAALTIQGKLGNWDVTYAGGYFDRQTDSSIDYSYYVVAYYASGGPSYTSFIDGNNRNIDPAQTFGSHDDYTKQTHELRLSSPGTDRFRVTAGVFYQRQTDRIFADFFIPGLASAVAQGTTSSPAIPGCGDSVFCTRASRVDRDYAAFADASFDITPTVTLNAGIRGFIANNTLEGFSGFLSALTPAPCGLGETAGLCNTFDKKAKENGETHKVNLTWKFDTGKLVYATYSTGYRPGGINRTLGVDPYKADTLTNYEIGLKTAWLGRRLFVNAAIFNEEWKGLQFGLASVATNGVVNTYNAGNARIRGVEGDISLQLGQFSLSGSGTYIDAKLTTDFCPIGLSGNPDCTVPPFVSAGIGTPLPVQPKLKGNINARYKFNLGSADAFVQATVNHQSGTRSYLTDSGAAALGNTGGFSTVDFSLGADMGQWKWQAYIQNALDRRGILSRNTACVPNICGAFARSYPIKPRLIGVKLGTSF